MRQPSFLYKFKLFKTMHKPLLHPINIMLCAAMLCIAACTAERQQSKRPFVSVRDGILYRGDSIYRFVGTNFWYAPILASEGRGGDRHRLAAELDTLCAMGITNLRVLVGADGNRPKQSLVWPTLQSEPGVYNDTLLAGLDWLMQELDRRDMTAVLFLNNSWEWSGGYAQYLEWAGAGPALDPTRDGYNTYTNYASTFATNAKAQQLFLNHVEAIVSRTNSYTGKAYASDPAIMAWQIGNEPRAFSAAPEVKAGFETWIAKTAALIKSIDANHLVSVGSEGLVGCDFDTAQYMRIHSNADIDYLTAHIWPMNWGWTTRDAVRADSLGTDTAIYNAVRHQTLSYLDSHIGMAERLGKPIVFEEFGYARDGLKFDLDATTHARDAYYTLILNRLTAERCSPRMAGINFWAWSGLARPTHERWQPGDDYCGDPAQEEQGLYSVFIADSTVALLRNAARLLAEPRQ